MHKKNLNAFQSQGTYLLKPKRLGFYYILSKV